MDSHVFIGSCDSDGDLLDTDDHIFIDIFDSDDFLNYFARRMAVGTEWAWLESTMRPTWIGLDWIGIK